MQPVSTVTLMTLLTSASVDRMFISLFFRNSWRKCASVINEYNVAQEAEAELTMIVIMTAMEMSQQALVEHVI